MDKLVQSKKHRIVQITDQIQGVEINMKVLYDFELLHEEKTKEIFEKELRKENYHRSN